MKAIIMTDGFSGHWQCLTALGDGLNVARLFGIAAKMEGC
jgi:hypothetical protein